MTSPHRDDPKPGSLVDQDLEDLVAELNSTQRAPRGLSADAAAEETAPRVFEDRAETLSGALTRELQLLVARGATDLHLVCGRPRVLRLDGRLEETGEERVTPELMERLFGSELGASERKRLAERGAVDFSLTLPGETGRHRFRVNLHRQGGAPAAAVRRLPARIPSLRGLGLPDHLADLVQPQQGLVVVCGPTGSGKTTTLAALVGGINRSRACHVVTIEDPVEYEHVSQRSLVEHVEIGRDTPSFAEALRNALRQDPDVIVVGEMRDLETIEVAVTAAETGHLILTSVHSSDAVQTLHRLVSVFPSGAQSQIRQQLSLSLNAIVSQRLIPRSDGTGRVVAYEKVVATPAVRRLVRDEAFEKIYNEVTLGHVHGMVSMEKSLAELVSRGQISLDEATPRSTRPEELLSILGGPSAGR